MKYILCVAFFVIVSLTTKAETLPIIKNVGPLIITEINGLKFLIDTGSNANFIDSKSLEKLAANITRVESRDKYVNTFAGKSKSESYDLNLKVGKHDFSKMESYVMNTSKFNIKNDGIDCCDGILGMPFIKKIPFKVDIGKKLISFEKEVAKLKDGKYRELNFEIEGKDTIVVSCLVDDTKIKLRLDTGSEAPLIYHKPAVDKYFLREQMFSQGYGGSGLPFFESDDFKCGANNFKNIVSTYFYGQGGALTHQEVDGNLGGYLLGEKYIFDFNRNKIFVSINELKFDYKSTIYKAKLKKTFDFKGHPSITAQAMALTFNSCLAHSDNESCMMKLCELENKSVCKTRQTKYALSDYVNSYFEIKTPDCSLARLESELRSNPVQYNFCWYKLFELNNKNNLKEDSEVQLPEKFSFLKNDVSLVKVNDVYGLTKKYYCAVIYNNIITSKELPPSLFAFSIKGISLGEESKLGYEKWINSSEGMECSKLVKDAIGENADTKLEDFKNKSSLIVLNPWTLVGDGVEAFDQNFERIKTHEVLHVLYAKRSNIAQYTRSKWEKLSKKEQKEFIKKHPSYNFDKEDILLREFFAYGHEGGENIPVEISH